MVRSEDAKPALPGPRRPQGAPDGARHHMANNGMTEARLRELYQRALAERGGRERAQCVGPDALLALVRREGSEEHRLEVLDHVMACEACQREFELLRSIEQAGAEAERATVARPWARRGWGWRQAAPLALAAS